MDNLNKNNMNLEINSYKVEDVVKALIEKLMSENPTFTYKTIAEKLGISERSVYRWMKFYNLPLKRAGAIYKKNTEEMVLYLNSIGYKVEKL